MLFKNLPVVNQWFYLRGVWSDRVVRYHSLILQQLPDTLEATAQTQAGEIMALRHKTLPLRGIQFHPEAALTENGQQLIQNWIDFCSAK